MASNAALQRFANAAAAGAPIEPQRVPALTGAEVDGNGRARRVALTAGTLSWQVKRIDYQYSGPVEVDAQQLASYRAGDVLLVPSDFERDSLVTEAEYEALVKARVDWETRDDSAAPNEPVELPDVVEAKRKK